MIEFFVDFVELIMDTISARENFSRRKKLTNATIECLSCGHSFLVKEHKSARTDEYMQLYSTGEWHEIADINCLDCKSSNCIIKTRGSKSG